MAFGNSNLLANQINIGDQLRDRMFNLKPCVHFQEEKLTRRIHQEFNRSGTDVIARLGHFDRTLSHLFPQRLVQKCRGGFFNHFLVSSLNAAFSLEEMDCIAMGITQYLNFDVPWLLNQPFNENGSITKRTLCLRNGALQF